ncbi:unnamed protein product, partial [Polarella glacialis]
ALRATVIVIGASGLEEVALNGRCSPYCVCQVQGKLHSRFQTVVVDESSDPVWNKTIDIDFTSGDALLFSLYNKELWPKKDILLGTAVLTGERVLEGFDGELRLEDMAAAEAAPGSRKTRAARPILRLKVEVASGSAAKSSAGRASMAPRDIASVGRGLSPTQVRETRADAGNQVLHLQRLGADDGPKRLKVQMQSARLLRGADLGSRSFSCSVMVSGRQYSRLQTGQASGGHQAVWNYEGEIGDYAPGEDLQFLLSSK